MPSPESKICLFIDDPQQTTLTSFRKVGPLEKPQNTRPPGISKDSEFLSADIFMPGDEAERVVSDIKNEWSSGRDALYTQYLGDETETALILGYTFHRKVKGHNLSLIQIYTPS